MAGNTRTYLSGSLMPLLRTVLPPLIRLVATKPERLAMQKRTHIVVKTWARGAFVIGDRGGAQRTSERHHHSPPGV